MAMSSDLTLSADVAYRVNDYRPCKLFHANPVDMCLSTGPVDNYVSTGLVDC